MADDTRPIPRRSVISWALYDWANSAFATTVMAGFFPVFFKQFWRAGASATESTFELGNFNSIAGIVVAAAAPILGAIADRGSAKKRFLLFFSLLGALSTIALFLISKGQWMAAGILYMVGVLGFSAGNVFYDSLLIGVSTPKTSDFVSALGYALGYLGGGVLFAMNVAMTLRPAWFGLADSAAAVRLSFVMVGVWWALFTIPLMLWVPEPAAGGAQSLGAAVSGGVRQLIRTFAEIRALKFTLLFLAAYWLYIDGVDTIVRMAVDYGISLGFPSNSLIVALLITQFVGFPAAIVFGKIGQRIGAKKGIFIGLAVYGLVTFWGSRMSRVGEFYILAIVIGLVQGGVQSLSRSLYSRLIPQEKAAEFFGFYNMLGKFAAVIGPALMGWVGVATGSPRLGILSILILFIAGAGLLLFVNEDKARQAAERG